MVTKEGQIKAGTTCGTSTPIDQDANYAYWLDGSSFSGIAYAKIDSDKFIRGSVLIGELGESLVDRQLASTQSEIRKN